MVSINFKKWMVFVLGLILAVSKTASAQLQCKLFNNELGVCVKIRNCPWLIDIILYNRYSIDRSFISSIQCGKIDGKVAVCCSNEDREMIISNEDHQENISNEIDISNHPNLGLLPSSKCGPITNDKLLRSDKLILAEMPWMARLQYETSSGLELLCEGSIINNRYILTADRCFSQLRKKENAVILGEHDTRTELDCETRGTITKCNLPRQVFSIEKTIPHKTDDIGLIRLSKPIIFDQDHIQPVCLPTSNETLNFKLKELLISGWGRNSDGVYDSTPSKVHYYVQDMVFCRKKYRFFRLTDHNKDFCAHEEGSENSCAGDAGSALVHPFDSNGYKYFQFGLFAFAPPDCSSCPGIYIKIQKYMDWILNNIEP